MASLVEFACFSAALVGQFAITVWLFNRLHALAMPRKLLKTIERLLLLASGTIGALALAYWLSGQAISTLLQTDIPAGSAWSLYALTTWVAATAAVPLWLVPKMFASSCPALTAEETTLVNVASRLGFEPVEGGQAKCFLKIPGNQLLTIAVQRKTLRHPRLPPELNGLKIAHLSDLHMTGQVTREYFEVVVAETNALEPDLVLITGDILEKEQCLPWIEPTLGRLRARDGVFFILGNHEYRLRNPAALRQAITSAGLVDLGSRWQQLAIEGANVLLAGNERPWFGTLPAVPGTDKNTFRILLSHTPDQFPWAQAQHFDLMLAGHNHGGQIRLPYLGALIAPSKYGFRYAGGVYSISSMLLHVSRM